MELTPLLRLQRFAIIDRKKKAMGDSLEAIHYFVGFWLFVFSKKFRNLTVNDWQTSGILAKVFLIFGAIFSTLFGLGLPVLIVLMIF